jgi:hypothetical protein
VSGHRRLGRASPSESALAFVFTISLRVFAPSRLPLRTRSPPPTCRLHAVSAKRLAAIRLGDVPAGVPSCRMCKSLRVPVATIRPNSSQRRVWKRNHGEITVRIGAPSFSQDRLDLWRGSIVTGMKRTAGRPKRGTVPTCCSRIRSGLGSGPTTLRTADCRCLHGCPT